MQSSVLHIDQMSFFSQTPPCVVVQTTDVISENDLDQARESAMIHSRELYQSVLCETLLQHADFPNFAFLIPYKGPASSTSGTAASEDGTELFRIHCFFMPAEACGQIKADEIYKAVKSRFQNMP